MVYNILNKIDYISRTLKRLYPEVHTSLEFEDPFTCLIATMLSANSTDKVVNRVTPKLFSKANSPEEFLTIYTPKSLYEDIRPVGLAPTKAKNILLTCKALIDTHRSKVPDAFQELIALPGVGGKTARVVLSQAYGKPFFPVDTHCKRLLTRWGVTQSRSPERISREIESLLPPEDLYAFHLRLVWYGRDYCVSRGHSIK